LILSVCLLAFLLNEYCTFSQTFINAIGVLAIVCEGTALYGLSGWGIQTWCGNTPSEKLNQTLHILFVSMGLFCAVLAYLLKACL
jgi:hypothetical protein